MASAAVESKVGLAVWSPCGQFIAVSLGIDMEVQESNTLEKLSTLKAPLIHANFTPESLNFSPDGHLIACSYSW